MFKKNLLLGVFGTIICIGGMTIIPIASQKIKQLDTKKLDLESRLRNLQNKYNSSDKDKDKDKDIKTIENKPEIIMISIEDAIEQGYTSDTFNLSENNKNKDTRKSEIKPLMDEGLTFDEAHVEIVNKKINEVTLISS
jgi:hypothetical protein